MNNVINIRCYEELSDKLPLPLRKSTFRILIPTSDKIICENQRQQRNKLLTTTDDSSNLFQAGIPISTVNDLIAALGIQPHDIDLVLVNGVSSGLDHILNPGDRVALYPVFERFDISSVTRVKEAPRRKPRFICDVHLGKLVKYLRMLGFDTLYDRHYNDDQLVEIALSEKRILLTRDKMLAKRKCLERVLLIISTSPGIQAKQVIKDLDLKAMVSLFCRCLVCNTLLDEAVSNELTLNIPERIKDNVKNFRYCVTCRRVYWEGSHVIRMKELVADILPE